ncbi:hypothetical protein VPJ68_20230, partial [Parabacteroides distasonis]
MIVADFRYKKNFIGRRRISVNFLSPYQKNSLVMLCIPGILLSTSWNSVLFQKLQVGSFPALLKNVKPSPRKCDREAVKRRAESAIGDSESAIGDWESAIG